MGQHSSTSTRRRLLAASASTALVLLTAGAAVSAFASPASADQDKVTICHRDDASNKPYVSNQPAKSGDLNGHADHTGPLYGPDLKSHGITWGDIIPPFDYTDPDGTHHFDGLNWPAGRATWEHDCTFVAPTLGLTVDKTNDANGDETFSDSEAAASAGSDVTFKVTVTNTGDAPVVLDSVVDKVGADVVSLDCSDLVGDVLDVGESATCTATATDYAPDAGGSKTNTVTVTGHQWGDCVVTDQEELRVASVSEGGDTCSLQEDPGNTVSASDDSTVTVAAASPSPTETTSPTPEPTVTETPTAEPTATATETSGGGGGGTIDSPSPSESPFTGGGGKVDLPFTGAPVGLLAGASAALLAFGAWLTFAARRTRQG